MGKSRARILRAEREEHICKGPEAGKCWDICGTGRKPVGLKIASERQQGKK